MVLPLPSAPGIDVTAERLKNTERTYEETPKSVNLAQPLFAGIQTADAMNEMVAKASDRDRAAMMQKLLDHGWEGYTAAWKAAGSPPKASPDLLRSVGEKPLTGYQMLADEKKKGDIETASKKFQELQTKGVLGEDGVTYRPATQAELDAQELELGTLSGKAAETASTQQTRNSGERKAAAANTARKQITDAKIELAKTEGVLNRLSREKVASMVKNKVATQSELNQYDKDVEDLARIKAELSGMESDPDKLETSLKDPYAARRYSSLQTQYRDIDRRIRDMAKKLPNEIPAADSGGSGGKKGKYNPATGKIEY